VTSGSGALDRSPLSLVTRYRTEITTLAAGLAGQAMLLVSGPLSARILGVTGRGYFALIVLFPTVLVVFGGLGLPLAVTYHVARRPGIAERLVRSLRSAFLIQVAVLTAVDAVAVVALSVGRPGVLRAGLAALPVVPAMLAHAYGLAVLQGQLSFARFNILRTGPPALYAIGLVPIFVLGDGDELLAVATCWSLAYAVSAALTVSKARRVANSFTTRDDGQPLPGVNDMRRFGMRSVLGSVSPVEMLPIDQALVALVLSPTALGLYVTALALASLPRLVSHSVGVVAYPAVASQPNPTAAVRAALRYNVVNVALTVVAVVVLESVVGWALPLLFGADFRPAVPAARVAIVGGALFGLRRVLSDTLRGLGNGRSGSTAEVVTFVVFAVVLIPATQVGGIVGAATAVAISATVGLTWLLVVAIRLHRTTPQQPAA